MRRRLLALAVLGVCGACREPNPAFEVDQGPADAGAPGSADGRPPDRSAAGGDRAVAPPTPGLDGGDGPAPDRAQGPIEARPPELPLDARAGEPTAAAERPREAPPEAAGSEVRVLETGWTADLPPERPDAGPAPDAPPAPPIACPNDRDLLLCLRFEGNVRDESPYAHAPNATGVDYVPGADGLALEHRSTSRVRIAQTTAFDVTRLTLEAWVNPRALPAGNDRYAVVDYQRQFSLFVYGDGAARCGASTGDPTGGEVRLAGVVRAGLWTSLACTVDADTIVLWVDGVARASRTLPAFMPNNDTEGGLNVGTNIPFPGTPEPDPFDGLIDNVRVWRRLRMAPEICAAAIGCGR